MAQILDRELDAAKNESLDTPEVLLRLTSEQLNATRQARIQRMLKEARFPDIKLMAEFDWEFQPSLDRGRLHGLARLDFLETGENVLFAGSSGTGKSHLAKALGVLACAAAHRVRFTTCENLFRDLYAGLADHSLPRRLKAYTLPELLIIDDLGFEEMEITQAGNANLLLKVINARYEKLSTIITSNIALDEWGKYLKDTTLAMATLDRFVHHATLFQIDGPSWREHQSRQKNLPPAAPAAPQIENSAIVSAKRPSRRAAVTNAQS